MDEEIKTLKELRRLGYTENFIFGYEECKEAIIEEIDKIVLAFEEEYYVESPALYNVRRFRDRLKQKLIGEEDEVQKD